jgi:hypothetical protein
MTIESIVMAMDSRVTIPEEGRTTPLGNRTDAECSNKRPETPRFATPSAS